MHAVIYLNRTMVEASKARIAPLTSATLYGRGVFTTVMVHGGRPFLWTKHWFRLVAHAEKLSIDLTGITEKSVGEAIEKMLAVNQVDRGLVRIIMLARGTREFWVTKSAKA
jgi:branched-subunit amino acid aminotransferase/4-amino-4-deoxychorismate lyase